MRYGKNVVTADMHYGGEEYQPGDCLPWLQLHCLLLSSLPAKKTMNSFGAFFKFQMDISDLILRCFYNFVIKPPEKL